MVLRKRGNILVGSVFLASAIIVILITLTVRFFKTGWINFFETDVTFGQIALCFAGLVTVLAIIFHFTSGNYVGDRLEGTWRAPCIQESITFNSDRFTRGRETEYF